MKKSVGAKIVMISPKGIKTTLSFNLAFKCTNNQAEYDALVIGLEILMELGDKNLVGRFVLGKMCMPMCTSARVASSNIMISECRSHEELGY